MGHTIVTAVPCEAVDVLEEGEGVGVPVHQRQGIACRGHRQQLKHIIIIIKKNIIKNHYHYIYYYYYHYLKIRSLSLLKSGNMKRKGTLHSLLTH